MVMLISYVYTIFNYITSYNVESVELLKVANERTGEELSIVGMRIGTDTRLELSTTPRIYGPPRYSSSPKQLNAIRNRLSDVDGKTFYVSNDDSSVIIAELDIEFDYDLSKIAFNGVLSIYLTASATSRGSTLSVIISIYAFNYKTNAWECLGRNVLLSSEYIWCNYTLKREFLISDQVRVLVRAEAKTQQFFSRAPPRVTLNVEIDYLNVTVSYFSRKLPVINVLNNGISSSRVVDIWLINSTHHIHLPCNVTIPPNSEVEIDLSSLQSAEVNGVSTDPCDIRLSPNSRYEIRIVTNMGNVFIYTFNT